MKKLVIGILAHVDAGKTTLTEALLYRSGCRKTLGRVDHQDAFLDTEALERERGITIFSKQALLPLGQTEIQLLDTPGHVDFSSEMERTLQVLDYAILVIGGSGGLQGHTRTLWRLLERWGIPTFLFVNKMDLPGADRETLLAELKGLAGGCVDFSAGESKLQEEAALCSEAALALYLEHGVLPREAVAELIAQRALFPCYFGSALKLDGVDELLEGLESYTRAPAYPAAFGARVYQIGRDPQGVRLTYLKVTGGTLRVKALLRGTARDGEAWEEKADQLRLYSGAKYRPVEEVSAGTVCAVTGLNRTYPGAGLGTEGPGPAPTLEPVLSYRVVLPEGCDVHEALQKLRTMEEEDPQLHLTWDERMREIRMHLMGAVQLEVLERLIADRFGLKVSFASGSIVYRETIAAPVEGVGHFEPLRHYAEVHLLLEPGEPGSGVILAADCPEEQLSPAWQRLILTHLAEKTHLGVLTGSPVTDLRITLVAGRAHVKHTEGGDFRQATYRAVRQGLMSAESVLLEPWYTFRLEVPGECVGRAMADIQRKSGTVSPPETRGEAAVLIGEVPAAEMGDYAAELAAYSRGRGRLTCTLKGYAPCHNAAEVIARRGYNPERDLENPSESVFCAHGAGFSVKWDQVRDYMHLDSGVLLGRAAETPASDRPAPARRSAASSGSFENDAELRAIFERTYGPILRRDFQPRPISPPPQEGEKTVIRAPVSGPDYLVVDGYNVIFAWDELKTVARDNLDAARKLLMDLLCNYQGLRGCEVILVFDAYRVPGGVRASECYHNIHVVYTKEAETADAYIEKTTYALGREGRVRVVTSDGAEQLIVLGHGALRVPAAAFREEVLQAQAEINGLLQKINRPTGASALRTAMERAASVPGSAGEMVPKAASMAAGRTAPRAVSGCVGEIVRAECGSVGAEPFKAAPNRTKK